MPEPRIPADLLPVDGRFGSGPSRVRPEALHALATEGAALLGTSHRAAPVRGLVRHVQEGLADLFALPDGYEVVLGIGGASTFWDVAAASLIEHRSQHLVFGEFGGKFAAEATAPWLEAPDVRRAPVGRRSRPEPQPGVDVYAWPHNETSTGVMAPVQRVSGRDPDALTVVDATSAAGGIAVDPTQFDAYYFSPQKNFSSDGGLWFALLSPAAIERAERIAATDRWIPRMLSLTAAIANSRKHQTVNTPAIATLFLLDRQISWILEHGGLAWADARTRESSGALYEWAEHREGLTPFVADPADRSQVVVTIDLDPGLDAHRVSAIARANGIVDIDAYRKLGRNQLRIGTFTGVDPDDVHQLIRSLDWVLDRLG